MSTYQDTERLEKFGIVSRSETLLCSFEQLRLAAASDFPILINGESGTGKELFARAAHLLSLRARNRYIPVNIASLCSSLVESELFGHRRGAFTGAEYSRIGIFLQANGGTLYIDEVAEIPLEIQVKLLRTLENKRFKRIGEEEERKVDFRLICATNQDLNQLVQEKKYREDFFYRINALPIFVPPLRDREDDIPLLVQYFLRKAKSEKVFSKSAYRSLQDYSWPGNVRELRSVVERLIVWCNTSKFYPDDVENAIALSFQANNHELDLDKFPTMHDLISRVEESHIRLALKLAVNKEQAIELLGISRDTFYNRLKEYRL